MMPPVVFGVPEGYWMGAPSQVVLVDMISCS